MQVLIDVEAYYIQVTFKAQNILLDRYRFLVSQSERERVCISEWNET